MPLPRGHRYGQEFLQWQRQLKEVRDLVFKREMACQQLRSQGHQIAFSFQLAQAVCAKITARAEQLQLEGKAPAFFFDESCVRCIVCAGGGALGGRTPVRWRAVQREDVWKVFGSFSWGICLTKAWKCKK